MTNGYIVLTKGEPNLYKHAVAAITLGKPIYYADGNKVAFVNSIELDSTNVVIKTSDKQITIEADGDVTVTTSGGLYVHTLNFLVTEDVYASNIRLSLITDFSDLITDSDLQSGEESPKWILNKYGYISASGFYKVDSKYYSINGIILDSPSSFIIICDTNDSTSSGVVGYYTINCSDIHTVSDDVKQLF